MSLQGREQDEPQAWHGEMPVVNRYTAGVAGERFLRAFKDEAQILGTRCSRCEVTYVPARQYCERCLDELVEWLEVGTRGQVHTYTLLYENLDGSRREAPEIVVFVRLGDGGLVHRLDQVEPEQVSIGMTVEAVFKPEPEREGSILDITHFRPVDEQG